MNASVDVLYEFFLGRQKLDDSLRNLHPPNVSPGPQTVHAMACNTVALDTLSRHLLSYRELNFLPHQA